MSPLIDSSALGKKSSYANQYDPSLLHPIPRQINRAKRQLHAPYPFCYGHDTWNAYEISWLNAKGKPEVRIGHFTIPFDSDALIESKSCKLYLNSLNNTRFASEKDVLDTLTTDLSQAVNTSVMVSLSTLDQPVELLCFDGITCLDLMDITTNTYRASPHFLTTTNTPVNNVSLYSNLLKSNCLVTHQPDWGTLLINYSGKKIDEMGLLKYIISLRDDNEFHEDCVEHVFYDLITRCAPTLLTVQAHYTRRGGLDINPIRSTHPIPPFPLTRTIRQ